MFLSCSIDELFFIACGSLFADGKNFKRLHTAGCLNFHRFADLAAQNEATVRTVARPAASARPAAPKAAPAPAPVREMPKAAPAPAKEAPKAAPPEEFDLDSILAEFK